MYSMYMKLAVAVDPRKGGSVRITIRFNQVGFERKDFRSGKYFILNPAFVLLCMYVVFAYAECLLITM